MIRSRLPGTPFFEIIRVGPAKSPRSPSLKPRRFQYKMKEKAHGTLIRSPCCIQKKFPRGGGGDLAGSERYSKKIDISKDRLHKLKKN